VLTLDAERVGETVPYELRDAYQPGLTVARIADRLRAGAPDCLILTGVPNARVAEDLRTLHWLRGNSGPDTIAAWRGVDVADDPAIDPEDFWDVGRDLPYDVDVVCASDGDPGRFDVVFRRPGIDLPHASTVDDATAPSDDAAAASGVEKYWRAYGNDPLHGMLVRRLVPDLRRHLQEKLPEYMVPPAYVVLDAMPLTQHGKIDRAALPEPDGVRSDPEQPFVGPRTPAEERLAEIWRDVLGVDRVGVHDTFFALGGHSLKATQLVSRVRDAFGVELPLRQVFQSSTIALLAQEIEDRIAEDIDSLSEDEAQRLVDQAEAL